MQTETLLFRKHGYTCSVERVPMPMETGAIRVYRVRDPYGHLVTPVVSTWATARQAWAEAISIVRRAEDELEAHALQTEAHAAAWKQEWARAEGLLWEETETN